MKVQGPIDVPDVYVLVEQFLPLIEPFVAVTARLTPLPPTKGFG